MKKTGIVALICILLDQIIKWLIISNMTLNSSIDIIPNFFALSYVQNFGAAWSILTGNRIFLIIIAILAIGLIYWFFLKNENNKTLEYITYGVLLGGIIGNLIDRIFHGYVIDYLDFNLFGYDYPIFNLADICIVLSVFLILIILWRSEKNEHKSRNK